MPRMTTPPTMQTGALIVVEVRSAYLPEQSQPEADRYAFSYTVRLSNRGSEPAKLVDRHWIITDAEARVEEVRGAGVVGETPHLAPGQSYEYTSGAVLRTPVGRMQGSYGWITDDALRFRSPIPEFVLSMPRVLH